MLVSIKLTLISPRLAGKPLSESTTNLVPSGDSFSRSLTSLTTRAMARGGKFSLDRLFVADEGFLEYECDIDDMICCCFVRLFDG